MSKYLRAIERRELDERRKMTEEKGCGGGGCGRWPVLVREGGNEGGSRYLRLFEFLSVVGNYHVIRVRAGE